jgi:hypothetical protein
MSDDLIERARDAGDHARYEPSLCHTLADRIAALEAQVAMLTGAREDALREAAAWCADEADKCEDAAKWGGAKAYLANCKAAAFALRNANFRILALINEPRP